jgi:hypothetical protein
MNQPTKTQREAIQEILKQGGAIASSDWTYGAGRYTSNRAVPLGFKRIKAFQVYRLKGFALAAAKKLLKERPRVRRLIVPENIRFIRKTLRATQHGFGNPSCKNPLK